MIVLVKMDHASGDSHSGENFKVLLLLKGETYLNQKD